MSARRWWWWVASAGLLASGLAAGGLAATAWAAEGRGSSRAPTVDEAPPIEHVDTSDTGDYAAP